MPQIKFDFNNMMADFIGKEGIKAEEITAMEEKFKKAYEKMSEKTSKGEMDWRNLPFSQKEIAEEIMSYAEEIKDKFDNFVILGIGGSALGPLALQQAINHLHYNELSKEKREGWPRFYVIDNVDPERVKAVLEILDLKKTVFNVITKSGTTSETMAQYMLVRDLLKQKIGEKYNEHIIATTDREKGNLIKMAKEEGFKTFYIPAGVGGRFSELSPVGLLPAAVCGIDIQQLLAGAGLMEEISENQSIFENPPFMAAMLQYLAMQKGKNISVMMPYADSLKLMADWYAQLWAESLGKRYNNQGKEVFVGQTPVKALGATDQHSQVQLYVEGPLDKVITFLTVDNYAWKIKIPEVYKDNPNLAFLGGHTMENLIKSEQEATEYALQKAGRMNRTIILPEVNAFTIGQLMYFFELETAFAGELLEIDAFNQPGVEEGKNATYALMGRPGYEEKKQELENRPQKKDEYII